MTETPMDYYFGFVDDSNFLVFHRALLEAMPEEWQERFTAIAEEYDRASRNLKQGCSPYGRFYKVDVAVFEGKQGMDLTDDDCEKLGLIRHVVGHDSAEGYSAEDDEWDITDADGKGHLWVEGFDIPLDDPVPHYKDEGVQVKLVNGRMVLVPVITSEEQAEHSSCVENVQVNNSSVGNQGNAVTHRNANHIDDDEDTIEDRNIDDNPHYNDNADMDQQSPEFWDWF